MGTGQGLGGDWADPVRATEAISQQIHEMADDDAERLNDVLRHLIDHVARRIEYAESRRGAFATIAAGFIAAGIAVLAIVVRAPASATRLALVMLAAGLLVTGALVLSAWGQQTNPKYGFIRSDTKLKRPWKWFYRDALADSNAFGFKWYLSPDSDANQKGAREFDRQWGAFAETQLGLSNLKTDVMQNLKQVYLLHVNEQYKKLFLSQERRLIVWGLVVTVFAALLTGAVAGILEGRLGAPPRMLPTSMSPSPS